MGEKNISALTSEETAVLKADLDAYGIKVSAIGSPLGKIKLDDDMDKHLETAKRVLADEYPELDGKIAPTLPDEKFRRVGQSMAAASLAASAE